MKRLCLALLVLALPVSVPLSAHANPELARQWAGKAANLLAETTDMIDAIDTGRAPEIDLPYLIEVGRFTTTASHLGVWTEGHGSAAGLGCIYHSMATIGAAQLKTLDVSKDTLKTRRALQQLAFMFADAEQVANATRQRPLRPAPARRDQRESCFGT